ncbi:MAG TPA: DUF2240 family protein [Candidatus Thalassarchaeaceae archaeon]|jgi:hypothetical protein|nr:DUF2240 family protein [Candidatus Thalassarchaeaceae archaeon]MDP7658989.1 DUF2240 family protein [Candidatus Thalassarchaeaceae archaeon]HJO42714.1 DUF2240 family protein [Candidatus Thalassarchaeaceae archaeon]
MSAVDEVSQLLFSVFTNRPRNLIFRVDLIRSWSLEMQWFTPREAEKIVNKLVESSWLIEDGEELSPAPGLELTAPNLGWKPISRRLLDVPANEIQELQPSAIYSTPIVSTKINTEIDENISSTKLSNPMVKIDSNNEHSTESYPIDRVERSIPILIQLISKESGLGSKEVVRRAQRKRRALVPVTLWMALALVAREQGLDMNKISSAIDNAAE